MTIYRIAITLLFLMPIYLMPVFSMHICIGQDHHHHGNCDGNMDGESEEKHAYQFEEAEHLQCFQLQKETNPCIYCKIDIPVQQLAVLAAVFNLFPDQHSTGYQREYCTPPNKEPPLSAFRIRPPPVKKG
jgi:hypothetical protein